MYNKSTTIINLHYSFTNMIWLLRNSYIYIWVVVGFSLPVYPLIYACPCKVLSSHKAEQGRCLTPNYITYIYKKIVHHVGPLSWPIYCCLEVSCTGVFTWVKEYVPAETVVGGTHTQTLSIGISDGGDFWAWSVEILMFSSPTGYMLTSSGFPLVNWGIFYKFL